MWTLDFVPPKSLLPSKVKDEEVIEKNFKEHEQKGSEAKIIHIKALFTIWNDLLEYFPTSFKPKG